MTYYTERHGMRQPIEKTYTITPPMYSLLLKCCEKYTENIAWKYPLQCPDGHGCCGMDQEQFESDMRFEIPSLFRDSNDRIGVPQTIRWFGGEERTEEYDQYSLLDYIEFFAQNCRDVEVGSYHSFFGHYHLTCKSTSNVFAQFQSDINSIFAKTGLLYQLTDDRIIVRIVEHSPLSPDIEKAISSVQEKGTKELLQEAISLYKRPSPQGAKDAVEKIWDALERLKTYYTSIDKKTSASKIINDMADGDTNFIDLFNTEFKALTDIGNNFRIRHHETNKVDITDLRHYDYFFNRCLSLIALAIQYLQ